MRIRSSITSKAKPSQFIKSALRFAEPGQSIEREPAGPAEAPKPNR